MIVPVKNTLSDAGDKPQVLLVEDNSGVADLIKSILKDRYEVEWALDGNEGISYAIHHVPDIIITDVMMPEKDGFEVAQALKEDIRTSHIPIIMLTAKADFDSKMEGLNLGAEAYLTKPFEKEELLIRIEKLLALRNQLQAYYSGQHGEGEDSIAPPTLEQAFVQEIEEYIFNHLSESNLTVQGMARKFNMSEIQFYRKLKALTGNSPVQFIRKLRLEEAIQLLQSTTLNISEIAYKVGFNDPNYFTRVFKKVYGKVPGEMRKN